jgi:serine/threonine protein kinase
VIAHLPDRVLAARARCAYDGAMSTTETWIEPRVETTPAETLAPATTLGGRHTVLPHVDVDGPVPRLVEASRARFEAVGTLGEGGLGVVVAANDLDIGRRVAIKRIRPDRQSQAAFLRFVQEVRTVGRLDHPNIVPIHDVGKDEQGGFYFVMKYVEGETLDAVLDRLRAGDRATHAEWGFERRLQLFVQILHAVEFAHDRGVVHRDLKPANVMIGKHGEVQLLDWGVAKQLDQPEIAASSSAEASPAVSQSVTHTRVGQLIGTPRYMSPEQARGEPADVQVDTWALSMVLYELLTLTHPLDGLETLDEVLAGITSRPIATPGQMVTHGAQGPVPAELGWIAVDGLHRDRTRRYRTVRDLLARIERRNDGDFPIQCPVTLQKRVLSRTSRFVDRHPIASMGLVVGSALAAGVGLFGALAATTSVLLASLGIAVLL